MPWLALNYRIILAASAIALMGILFMRLQVVTAQRNEAITNLDTYKIQATMLANQAKKESDNALEIARNDYAISTAAAEKNAWNNAKNRFGVACGIGTRGLPNLPASLGGSEAGVSEGVVPVAVEESVALGRSDIEDYAKALAWVKAVKSWCHANELKGCE